MSENFQIKLDKILNEINGRPRLFLHACCAPCASYVLEYLSKYFDITAYFYNPNIEYEECKKRYDELSRLISLMPLEGEVTLLPFEYSNDFDSIAKGFEDEPEGGARCERCFALRLDKTAKLAKENGFDYFTTTLSISPHKNSELLNKIGNAVGEKYGISHLPCDFKKRNGYRRSIELSNAYNLYRQNFCGCIYSKR